MFNASEQCPWLCRWHMFIVAAVLWLAGCAISSVSMCLMMGLACSEASNLPFPPYLCMADRCLGHQQRLMWCRTTLLNANWQPALCWLTLIQDTDSKDLWIDIDWIWIRHFHVGSISNRCWSLLSGKLKWIQLWMLNRGKYVNVKRVYTLTFQELVPPR